MKFILFLYCFSLFAKEELSLREIIFSSSATENEDLLVQNMEQVEEKTVRSFQSLEEVFRAIPSLTTKNSGNLTSFYYRGLPSRYSMILVNGIPLLDLSSIDTSLQLSYLNIGSVKRVEVLTGAQSVLYGSGANTSVINIITDKYDRSFTMATGSRLFQKASGLVEGQNYLGHINMSYEQQNQRSDIEAGSEKDEKEFKEIRGGLDFSVGNVEIESFFSKSKIMTEYDGFDESTFLPADQADYFADISRERIGFRLHTGALHLTSSLDQINREDLDSRGKTQAKSHNWFNDAHFNLKGNVTLGLTVENQQARIENQNEERTVLGVYGLIERDFGSHSLSLGARENRIEGESAPSFSAGLSRKLSKNFQLKYNYSEGLKLPSFYQEERNHQDRGVSLLSEKSKVHELSLVGKSLKLTGFVNHIEDLIFYAPFPQDFYLNRGRLKTEGVEFQMDWRNFRVGGSMLNRESKNLPVPYQNYFAMFELQKADISFNLRGDYFSEAKVLGESLPDYTLAQLFVSKQYMKQEFSIRVRNIFNTPYIETPFYSTPGRTVEFLGKLRF